MKKKILYPPFLLIVWFLITLVFVVKALTSDNIFYPALITLFISGLFYFYFLNASCYIICENQTLVISYSPFVIKETILLSEISKVSVLRGFYSIASDNQHPVNNFVPKICYDTLTIFYRNGENRKINVNLLIGHFKYLSIYINQRINK